MFLMTYNPNPTKMELDLLMNLPLIMEYKDLIYSSYLLYNIETGCSYVGKDGVRDRFELRLGELMNLWEQEDTPWHFYDRSRQEIFTFKIIEQKIGEYLCFGWGLQDQKACVYTITDTVPYEASYTTQAIIQNGKKPAEIEGLPKMTYQLASVYSGWDFVKSLLPQRPVKDVFYERIAQDPYALSWCKNGTYLYPTDKNPHGFYAKKFV